MRGVAAAFRQRGCELRGFDASVRSTVLPGSGLSSSAAFEVLIGTILNELFFDRKLTAVEIAQIGQYAENVYFGKPSGLMDQTASSVGGLVFIDFADPQTPLVERVEFDFAHCGYTPCILDSGADHADLTDEYAAIPQEMRSVARCFGKEVLREVNEAEFYAQLKQVREQTGDRAVLRAMHFFDENRRVLEQVQALKNGDFEGFLAGVRGFRPLVVDAAAEHHSPRQHCPSADGAGAGSLRKAAGRPRRLPRARRRLRGHDPRLRAG